MQINNTQASNLFRLQDLMLGKTIETDAVRKLYYKSDISVVSDDDKVLEKAKETAIPEFLRFNIVENEVRNVI